MILFFPLFATIAWIHALLDDQPDTPKQKLKPVYVMQSTKPRPSHRSSPRTRDADFYRDRRVKKAIRKLPF